MGEDVEARPGCVNVEPPGCAVDEAVCFQVADGEFAGGVGAVMLVFVTSWSTAFITNA